MNGARLNAGDLIETGGNGRQQNLVIDRLDEVIVRSRLLAAENVVPLRQGCQEDEGNVRHGALLSQGLQHVVAAKAGHGDIAEDEVGTVPLEETERLAAVGGLEHTIVGSLQFFGDVAPQIVLVFNAKNCFLIVHWSHHSCSLLRLIGIGYG